MRTLLFASAAVLALSGAAMAQDANTGGGSGTGSTNHPANLMGSNGSAVGANGGIKHGTGTTETFPTANGPAAGSPQGSNSSSGSSGGGGNSGGGSASR